MSQRCVRAAIGVTVVALIIVAEGLGTVVSAADCEIPAFLVTGKTYLFGAGIGPQKLRVVEIDRRTCWIKANDGKDQVWWVNLGQVFAIQEVPSPSAPTPPGQRR
jgi:hypothetical protein